jgi:hypothetical protein
VPVSDRYQKNYETACAQASTQAPDPPLRVSILSDGEDGKQCLHASCVRSTR